MSVIPEKIATVDTSLREAVNPPSLLPPNATELEQSLEAALDYPPDPDAVKQTPVDLSSSSPALLARYQLGELTQWLAESALPTLQQALACQRLKGTPEALRLALGWLRLTDVVIEDDLTSRHFAEYQCGIRDRVLSADAIWRITGLLAWAAPARSHCRRLYNTGYDNRYFVPSESGWGNALSDDSGVAFTLAMTGVDNSKANNKKSQATKSLKSLTVSFGRSFYQKITVTAKTGGFLSRSRFFTASTHADQQLDFMKLDTHESILSHRMILGAQERVRVVDVPVHCVAGGWHSDFFSVTENTNKNRGNSHGNLH
nr:hypothetical protein 12 [Coxiellaceae bacterium]